MIKSTKILTRTAFKHVDKYFLQKICFAFFNFETQKPASNTNRGSPVKVKFRAYDLPHRKNLTILQTERQYDKHCCHHQVNNKSIGQISVDS